MTNFTEFFENLEDTIERLTERIIDLEEMANDWNEFLSRLNDIECTMELMEESLDRLIVGPTNDEGEEVWVYYDEHGNIMECDA